MYTERLFLYMVLNLDSQTEGTGDA
jgi:hypothetical protein